MTKAVVFDLGGTLMEYVGMPLNWEEYYDTGIRNVSARNGLNLSEEEMLASVKVLKDYNPRNSGREYEVAPEIIFCDVMTCWKVRLGIEKAIDDFFSGMALEARVFDYAEAVIRDCKNKNLYVACLTDLPNGMPDKMFRSTIAEIEPLFDLYVSSQTCGFRKPNKNGIECIAGHFGIEVSEVLFVGDEKKDEETARNAGCGFEYIDEYLKANVAFK